MRRVCVYAGSNPGSHNAYADAVRALARTMAARGIRLVYGGGKVGLMGVLADTMLGAGGEAIGVMPQALIDRDIGHPGLDRAEGRRLAAFLDHAVDEAFLHRQHRAVLSVAADPAELLDRLAAFEPPTVEEWLDLKSNGARPCDRGAVRLARWLRCWLRGERAERILTGALV